MPLNEERIPSAIVLSHFNQEQEFTMVANMADECGVYDPIP